MIAAQPVPAGFGAHSRPAAQRVPTFSAQAGTLQILSLPQWQAIATSSGWRLSLSRPARRPAPQIRFQIPELLLRAAWPIRSQRPMRRRCSRELDEAVAGHRYAQPEITIFCPAFSGSLRPAPG